MVLGGFHGGTDDVDATEVLVVGAGPTGLTLAVDLARRGVRVRIVDGAAAYFTGSRGKSLQERSLEVLADLGVAEPVRAAGWTPTTRMYVGGNLVREIPAGGALVLPQWAVEQALRDRLAGCGVTVELDTVVTGLDQCADGVVAHTSRGPISARWLVGCDGGHSNVRKALGVAFDGDSSATRSVVLGDVEVSGLSPECVYLWIEPSRGMLALTPFRTEAQWQLVAAAPADAGEPSLDELRRQFAVFTGLDEVRLDNPTWLSSYRVGVRMTREYRVGRVFLAGDAAHVHPPTGGLGMNTGIQDAYNLGWKLARTVAGTASPELLDTYQAERVPIAEWTLGTSSAGLERVWSSVTDGSGDLRVREPEHDQLGLGYRDGPLSQDLATWDGPRAGDRAPWTDRIGGGGFTVLGFGAAAAVLGTVRGARTGAMDGPADVLVLVRPDGHVGMVADPSDLPSVQDYIDRP